MKYKLSPLFTLRKTDKAVFNFSRAELTQFNDTGFDILLEVLEQVSDREWTDDEGEFLKELIKEKNVEES
ncbi:hypothetical protein LMG8520_0878 [Lactococcus lactis subsp. lactis]|uniref:Uncharacterized protein n=2 Tax=Lactococcus lactis TaxID=1358 RepID=A0A5M9PX41_LACLH|nr:hypothetical protein [Lactococcus lactis]KAA8700506.1 hypothetical protein F4V48_10390 [Lactococcus lactis subsp. hordniae]KSU11030.1 hypothetical protein LMG8520_0878 [Lactococcus lactis subsp. lactis]MCT3135281.1 hypothetical protein [Lactococcus lactis]